ncbi:MAG: twin-arginine translocation signal domain-containing protein [Deltaproteobacteria bacterium]|nr:twin-arginine translocation signal domain-containing protein [Deltaproteobacteria bacterium]
MTEKISKNKTKNQKVSRRGFLKTAAVAGATAGALGFPAVMRLSAAPAINIKMQTAWDAGTLGYVKFKEHQDADRLGCRYPGLCEIQGIY